MNTQEINAHLPDGWAVHYETNSRSAICPEDKVEHTLWIINSDGNRLGYTECLEYGQGNKFNYELALASFRKIINENTI